tara:strand:- start:15175 stop:15312 length:138 start_codon:yes stop_codon:yes gene_type:complete
LSIEAQKQLAGFDRRWAAFWLEKAADQGEEEALDALKALTLGIKR